MTATEIENDERTATTDDGDHERFSHYVTKKAREKAWLEGTPCVALCGKKWVPNRDPDKFPICPNCKDVYDLLFGNKEV